LESENQALQVAENRTTISEKGGDRLGDKTEGGECVTLPRSSFGDLKL